MSAFQSAKHLKSTLTLLPLMRDSHMEQLIAAAQRQLGIARTIFTTPVSYTHLTLPTKRIV